MRPFGRRNCNQALYASTPWSRALRRHRACWISWISCEYSLEDRLRKCLQRVRLWLVGSCPQNSSAVHKAVRRAASISLSASTCRQISEVKADLLSLLAPERPQVPSQLCTFWEPLGVRRPASPSSLRPSGHLNGRHFAWLGCPDIDMACDGEPIAS